jgi:hypothetical protein
MPAKKPDMRDRLCILLWVVAVGMGTSAFAQSPTRTEQIDGAVSTSAPQSTLPPSTTLRMHGKIDKYERAPRRLSISTSNGSAQFTLAPDARVRQGWQRIDASALEKLGGSHVAVRYSESETEKIAQSVHVFGRNERAER